MKGESMTDFSLIEVYKQLNGKEVFWSGNYGRHHCVILALPGQPISIKPLGTPEEVAEELAANWKLPLAVCLEETSKPDFCLSTFDMVDAAGLARLLAIPAGGEATFESIEVLSFFGDRPSCPY